MLLFGRRKMVARNKDRLKITLNNSHLPFVENAKNLGIIFDSKLEFSEQVTSILKKGYGVLKILYGSKDILNRSSRLLTCNSLVLSNITYGLSVFGPFLTKDELYRLQKLQNCCLRFIFSLRKYDHISRDAKQLEILPIKEKIEYHSCMLFYKVLKSKCPTYLHELVTFRNDVHHLNLRHKHTIVIPAHSTAIFQNSFSYRIAKLMNSFKSNTREVSFLTFKRRLKTLLLNRSYE